MKGGREKEMGEEVEGRCRQADFSNSTVYWYKILVQQCGTGTRTGTTFRTGTHPYTRQAGHILQSAGLPMEIEMNDFHSDVCYFLATSPCLTSFFQFTCLTSFFQFTCQFTCLTSFFQFNCLTSFFQFTCQFTCLTSFFQFTCLTSFF